MTNFGTMRYKHIISVVLWSMFLVACGPDRRVALAEKLIGDSLRQIKQGLSPQERYVTKALMKVRNGMRINPVQ